MQYCYVLRQSYSWYETQISGLGEEFLRAIEVCFASIQRTPFAFTPVHENVRRALIRKFPFAVFYFVESDRIIVLGCFHARRDPKQWEARL